MIIIGNRCNTISDNIVQTNSTFIPAIKGKFFRVDTLIIFNKREGNVVDFYGTRTCTVTVNGAVDPEATGEDSIFIRITNLGETILVIGDSTYGRAKFQKEDVINWNKLVSYIKDTSRFTGEMIVQYLSSEELESIKVFDTSTQLSDSYKTSIITALNKIIDICDFYHIYKTRIDSELSFHPRILDSLYEDVNLMIKKSIMLSTDGAVKSNLTVNEREAIKWFNWAIFTQYLDHQLLVMGSIKVFHKYSSAGIVYCMLFQQGPSQNKLNENEILRYLEIKNSGMYQLAYKDQYGIFQVSDTKIADYIFTTSTYWTVTPLFWEPNIPFIPDKEIPNLVLPGSATIELTDYSWFLDTMWYDIKLYYPLNGSILQNGKPLRVAGTIVLTIGFYKFNFGGDHGTFTHWNSEINIQATSANGDIFKYIEKRFMKSDNGR